MIGDEHTKRGFSPDLLKEKIKANEIISLSTWKKELFHAAVCS